MIADSLKNARDYFSLGGNFQKAFEYLMQNNLEDKAEGKYEIDGDNIFVIVQSYDAKPESEGKLEAHRKYADIQFIIEGEEKIGYANIEKTSPVVDYDDEKDIIFLDGDFDFILVQKNDFMVFFPQDAHMPSIVSNGGRKYVKKAVIKIKV